MTRKHEYQAKLEGTSVKVYDKNGEPVEVFFAGTLDNCTCYAYTKDRGFIGGWQRGSRAKKGYPWRCMVDAINLGIHYDDMNELPKTPWGNPIRAKDIGKVGLIG